MIVTNFRSSNGLIGRWARGLAFTLLGGFCLTLSSNAQQGTQPIVAIHDSELTRALETMPAVPPTPTNGTTGKQWWATDWHYFVMPDSLKEAFTSDGTAFTVIGDSNVSSGLLLSNGAPKYPIVFSLASEAIRADEIAQFTNYVAAGGFLFVSGSAFTRDTNGVSLGDFAFANQMGVHMVVPGLLNWGNDSSITRQSAHRLVNHLPTGQLTWRLPSYSEEVNWGISPAHIYTNAHDVWQITASDATVIAQGDVYPYITVKPYGKGYFIYEAAFNPIVSHGGFGPGMYSYMIFRKAVEWAFESANLPVPKLSPWPYQYDAAMMIRHDLEDYDYEVTNIEASAAFEASNGVRGDYYFCTGTLRVDMVNLGYDTNAAVQSLRRAMTNYGATISSHNGGLKNASNNSLSNSLAYDYWHWGPDEALDFTPAGYPNGTAYATASVSNSFKDIESWLPGLMTPSMRTWVACNFNSTREASYNLQSQLGIKIIGDQKISPFPHWTLSTQTPDKKYAMLTEPVSEWFVNGALAQSLEPWHPPGVQTSASLHTSIDYYYNLGTLVNFYSHTMSTGLGDAGQLEPDYVTYCVNTNAHPRLWTTNGIGIYQWWLTRSNVQVSVSFSTNGLQSTATYSIHGATDPNTAIEMLVPGGLGFCTLRVQTNGVLAGSNTYRILNNQLVRVKVGSAVTNASISYYPQGLGALVFSENFDGVSAGSLPAGWTSTASGGESAWVTQTSSNDTAPNSVFVADVTSVGLSSLVSPPIAVPAGQSQLSFRNNYNLEGGPGGSGFDGGVLQIKIGTNAFVDILAAGGSFVSGGYVGNLATTTSSPLAGQQTWCGSSGGYITTVVNLPAAAAGQTNQFQWVCGTDSGGKAVGWWIDTVAITNLACLSCSGGTNVPVLTAQTNRTVNEGSLVTVTNVAMDADGSSNVLTYSLVNPPATAQIDQNGVITWTPSEAQGPSTNTITTVVTDCTGLSATNSFKIFVNEVNTAPIYPAPGTQTVNEGSTLLVTNTATDADIPANTLTYQLVSPPANMAINTNTGVITFNPDETQGPGTNVITTVVTDFNPWDAVTPHLSATNTFTIIVNEVNTAPSLPVQTNRSVNELTLLTVTNAATDTDVPANTFSYTLVNPPTGASIDPTSGVITWIPSGTQGPSTNTITTVVTDFNQFAVNSQHLSATNSFQVIVNDTATCQYAAFYQEGFDGVTAPALPAGWTTSASGAESNWVTQTTVKDAGVNAVFSPDVTAVGSNSLVSPIISNTPAGPLILSFRNNYAFETGPGTDGYDGGVLEIKIGAGAFADIQTAGGSFLSGGYNSVIDPAYSNVLKNRQAWSGNSGGFITTTVSLPSAASATNIQFRWICGTDTANGSNGWRIDTISISNLVCSSGPVLAAQSNRTIGEFSTLIVTNSATEAGNPSAVFTYQLVAPPGGAVIDTNTGIITWSPTQSQSPSTNTITTMVTDNSSPTNLTATNSFQVFVKEVNIAPQPQVIGAQTINELLQLTVNDAATETNIHATITGYGLVSPLAGMNITSNGLFTWTPSQTQSPSTNTITVVVTNSDPFDLVNPILTATNSFQVTVKEVNVPPSLPTNGTLSVNELVPVTVTNTATNANIHSTIIGYNLINPLSGMNITSNGIFTWNPPQSVSPSTNTITVVATNSNPFDAVNPKLTATNTFTVIVKELNVAPALLSVSPQTINELLTLTVTNTATNANVHSTIIGFGLISPLSGMNITAGGVFTWTPGQSQSPSTNTVTVVVTNNNAFDSVNPTLTATNTFQVFVKEVNVAPTLLTVSPQTINELLTLTVTNTATNANIHSTVTGYGLINPLSGMNITAGGVFTWTPGQNQSPSTNTVTVVVTNNNPYDAVNPTLTATNTFQVFVKEVNVAPTLLSVSPQTINELLTLTVTNTATNANVHSTITGYGLISPLSGMNITAGGIFTWTPGQNVSPSTNTVTVVATNNNTFDTVNPTLTATNTFQVVVKEVNTPPVFVPVAPQTVNELIQLTVTNLATNANIHSTITGYGLAGQLTGMNITAGGVFTWTPTPSQSHSTNTVTVVATNNNTFDTVNPSLTSTNTFQVIVKEINVAPVLPSITPQTVNEQIQLIVTNTATEPNVHATTTGYAIINPLPGMNITAGGIFTWTPSQSQSPGTNTITIVVTNNDTFDAVNPTLTATNTFMVYVKEVNVAPILQLVAPQTVNEQIQLIVTNLVTQPNIHATTTGFGIVGPLAGMNITSNGIFTWTPAQNQSPSTNVVTVVVTNNDSFDLVNPSLTATNTFQVIVKEINITPQLPTIPTQNVNVLNTLTVTNAATNANIHATILGYGLVNPPANMGISAGGIITWTPGTNMANTTNLITTVVTNSDAFDPVNPQLTATNTFSVVVNGVHNGPSLPAKSDVTINNLDTIIVTNTATDNDIPLTALSYHLVNAPGGANIDGNGIITWSPTGAQSSSTNLITTVVSDTAFSPLSATNTFNIIVGPAVTPPVILSIGVTNTVATITWSATSGHTYRLQFKNSGDTNWTEVPLDITCGTNLLDSGTATTTNACGNSTVRFYRVNDIHETIRR